MGFISAFKVLKTVAPEVDRVGSVVVKVAL